MAGTDSDSKIVEESAVDESNEIESAKPTDWNIQVDCADMEVGKSSPKAHSVNKGEIGGVCDLKICSRYMTVNTTVQQGAD